MIQVPNNQSFILIDANARTGVEKMMENCKTRGTCADDYWASDSNWTGLLRLANNNRLSLVNTFFYNSLSTRGRKGTEGVRGMATRDGDAACGRKEAQYQKVAVLRAHGRTAP